MRLIVWCCHRVRPQNPVYSYLLKHPRRVFSHLFPHYQTVWLLIVLLVTNIAQFAFFLGLEWDQPILAGFTDGEKVLNAFFQSISTRTAGFNSVDLALSHPAMSVLYLGMMYLAVYPVTAFIRSSAVSEKKSTAAEKSASKKKLKDSTDVEMDTLGFSPAQDGRKLHNVHVVHRYKSRAVSPKSPQGLHVHKSSDFFGGSTKESQSEHEDDVYKPARIKTRSRMGYQIQTLLYRDITWVFLSTFVICCVEGQRMRTDADFTIFKVLFEVVSAYGTVGLTLGYPGITTSFCSVWTTGSKVIIAIVMVMGRHRGLPESIDPSVRLPSIPEMAMAQRHKKLKVSIVSPKDSIGAEDPDSASDVVIDMRDEAADDDSETTTRDRTESKERISDSSAFSPAPIRRIRRHASLDSISLPSQRLSKEKDRPKERVPFALQKQLSRLSLVSNHTTRSDLGCDLGFLDDRSESSSSEELKVVRRAYSMNDMDRVEYN